MHPDVMKRAQEVMRAVNEALADLDIEYIELMHRLGVKSFVLHRI